MMNKWIVIFLQRKSIAFIYVNSTLTLYIEPRFFNRYDFNFNLIFITSIIILTLNLLTLYTMIDGLDLDYVEYDVMDVDRNFNLNVV